jgi:hypothetical protein
MGQSKTVYLLLFGIPTLLMAGFSVLLILITLASITTASPHGIPRESILPSIERLSTWGSYETPYSSALVVGSEMRLSITEDAWDLPPLDDPDGPYSWAAGAWTYRSDYADFSASIDVKALEAAPYASGCLMVRSDPAGGPGINTDPATWDEALDAWELGYGYSFNLCLSEEDGLYAWWGDATATEGEYSGDFVYLWGEDIDAAIRPMDEWNRLKIIAKGETIWMFINGQYAGAARYPGPHNGSIGMRIDVERDGYGTFAFCDLEIRRLGWI